MAFLKTFVEIVRGLDSFDADKGTVVEITGRNLTLVALIAFTNMKAKIRISQSAIDRLNASADFVLRSLLRNQTTYGVNTGFGGSANTRTSSAMASAVELQRLLMRGLHYGVLSKPLVPGLSHSSSPAPMPESWTRSAMIVLLNSLIGGASGWTLQTLNVLHQLIENNIVPRIPLRGSISASGDLSPLSYIGGVMQGKPSISVWHGDNGRNIVSARQALGEAGISPITFGPKEGLAITNGTAMSSAVAALALGESISLYAISLALTGVSVEALNGTAESFDPFFAEVRPHQGQIKAADLVMLIIDGSGLTIDGETLGVGALRQDRYWTRTATQWMGPAQEDLLLAYTQSTTELNSITDNPLVDVSKEKMLHGGNFQARSVTSACEKIRISLQSLGRMLFSQCTEMINPALNRGLPPNLVADEPSQSFLWKDTDLLIAALCSELGFLANPVGSHVMTAGMGNQALNSLALISARYTMEAVDCLSQMAAAHLVAVCQALDLRALIKLWQSKFRDTFLAETDTLVKAIKRDAVTLDDIPGILEQLWAQFLTTMETAMSEDTSKRFDRCLRALQPTLLDLARDDSTAVPTRMREWTTACAQHAFDQWHTSFEGGIAGGQLTEPLLGRGSRLIYRFVRTDLRIPFIKESTLKTPPEYANDAKEDFPQGAKMGDYITRVYQSLRAGEFNAVLIAAFGAERETSGAS